MARRRDEGADALLRNDQPLRAQTRDGLAHDVTADAEILSKKVLGRQTVARLQSARRDLFIQRARNVLGQMGPALDGAHIHITHGLQGR